MSDFEMQQAPAPTVGLTTILPCNQLDASERFYNRPGFSRPDNDRPAPDEENAYRILHSERYGDLHLTDAVEGWLVPGKNPFGFYLSTPDASAIAAEFGKEILEKGKKPEDKPWGMYEFALFDPDGTLVRIGWPTRLRNGADEPLSVP